LLTAVAWLVLGIASADAARDQTVTFAQMGFRDTITLNGVYPSFTLNVPRYPSMEKATLLLGLHVSPLVDERSSFTVFVNDTPVFARYVKQIGRDPHLEIPLPVVPPGTANLAIGIRGYLTVTNDVCTDLQAKGLYVSIDPASAIRVRVNDENPSVGDFFRSYGSAIGVVAPTDSLDASSLGVVALPYRIRQIEAWHQPTIELVGTPQPGERTIVVRRGATSIDRSRSILSIDPGALGSIRPRTVEALLGSSASGITLSSEERDFPSGRQAGLADLGMHPQTLSGFGDLAYATPLYANSFGGTPKGLVFHLSLAHTPLLASSSGMLQVQLNGRLVAARELGRAGGTEALDAPLPASLFSSVNDLRVIVSYYIGQGSCRGSWPTLTATILDGSSFTWDSVDTTVYGIADFVKSMSGRVAVLVADPAFVPAAFHFMAELGTFNTALRDIDVVRYTGDVPKGYDYALIFAPPAALASAPIPVRPTNQRFRVVNPQTGREIFSATEDRPFATVQTARIAGTASLVFSYYRDPRAIARLADLGSSDFLTQTGNVAFVGDNVVGYSVGPRMRVVYAEQNAAEAFWERARLPLLLVLVALVVIGTLYASRRLTGKADS
jgi:hypothetical protein